MKQLLYILFFFSFCCSFSQNEHQGRILKIAHQLDALAVEVQGLTEHVKSEINVNNVTLTNFLLAVSEIHEVNINVAPELNTITLANSFTNVTISDLLVFLCKEYNLTIEFTGNILSVKPFVETPKIPEKHPIPLQYNPNNNRISIDARGDKLYDLFKQITDASGKNLVFAPGLENKLITLYLQDTPFEVAMDKLAFANNLYVERSKDGFFVFEDNANTMSNVSNGANATTSTQRPTRRRKSNFFFEIKDMQQQLLEVDFVNTPIAAIINDIGNALNIDVFTATPLDAAGNATFKSKSVTFDALLTHIFETQNSVAPTSNTNNSANNTVNNRANANRASATIPRTGQFTFKRDGNTYFFGTSNQLSVREVAIIHLQHRSVELLADPSGGMSRSGGTGTSYGSSSSNFNSGYGNSFDTTNSNRNRESINTNSTGNFNTHSNKAEALVNILPDEVKQDLDIKVDFELNSFYVNGPSANIQRFRNFIHKIDQPVPVVLIEVMIIEVSKNSTVETGVSWGIGDEPTTTSGGIYPETNINLGATTINKIIGGFDGFGSFNLGQVVPNFFASIKAMESNGDLKIRSTPKLSTLNGHRAYFSNGQTSYYAVTQRNIYGTDNPQTSEITNYYPIDAELGFTIKPLVSGDGQVTLDISLIQSSFGSRIAENAPPDISSREFSSLIRMKDQDIAVLGGLEEQMSNNSGNGVPLLARIPIIKWLFSKRKREGRKTKLTILIKPTIIH